jgi:hypothetical protein
MILFEAFKLLWQKISRHETLSAMQHHHESVDAKVANIPASSVMLDIDDAEFIDWCKKNPFAGLWYCP